MLHDAAAAEDAVQEAAFSAWRKRRDLRDPARARAWFLSIVANQCRSARRRRWWSVLRLPETASVPGHAETVSSGVALRRAVSGLGHRNRLVVVLRFYLDLPVEEVAAVTGLSADAVESRLRRAVKELRKVLVDADV